MRVFIAVLSHTGGAKELGRVHQAIIDSTYPSLQTAPYVKLIWLEQGSTVNAISDFADLREWHSTNNVGCAMGRQRLIDSLILIEHLSPDDLLIFLDDDIQFLQTTWLQDFINTSLDYDVFGVEAMKVLSDYTTEPIAEGKEPDYVSGGWCGWHGYVLLDGVQFDRNYHTYFEDVDMCYQARQKKYSIGQVKTKALAHESHMTPLKSALYEQSRAYFIKKWQNQDLK